MPCLCLRYVKGNVYEEEPSGGCNSHNLMESYIKTKNCGRTKMEQEMGSLFLSNPILSFEMNEYKAWMHQPTRLPCEFMIRQYLVYVLFKFFNFYNDRKSF